MDNKVLSKEEEQELLRLEAEETAKKAEKAEKEANALIAEAQKKAAVARKAADDAAIAAYDKSPIKHFYCKYALGSYILEGRRKKEVDGQILISNGKEAHFKNHLFSTTDPDLIEMLRKRSPEVIETKVPGGLAGAVKVRRGGIMA